MRLLLLISWIASATALLASGASIADHNPSGGVDAPREQCDGLAARMAGRWPDVSTRITSTQFHAASEVMSIGTFGGPPTQITVPAHCELFGILRERTGAFGQRYAIRFHVRLPAAWNERFFFQAGGGTNGEIGNALGQLAPNVAPALVQGFA